MNLLNTASWIVRLLPVDDRERLEDELIGSLTQATADGHHVTVMDLLSLVLLVVKKWTVLVGPSVLLGLPAASFMFLTTAIAFDELRQTESALPPWQLAPLSVVAAARAVHLARGASYLLPGLLLASIPVGLSTAETIIELTPGQALPMVELVLLGLSATAPLTFLLADRIVAFSQRSSRRPVRR